MTHMKFVNERGIVFEVKPENYDEQTMELWYLLADGYGILEPVN